MPPLLPTASFPDLRLAKQQVSQGRHLPCWEATGAIYHIAFHLADSVPRLQLEIWQAERARLAEVARAANRPLTQEERDDLKAVYNDRVEKYLSANGASCPITSISSSENFRRTARVPTSRGRTVLRLRAGAVRELAELAPCHSRKNLR